jgi:hypothetical protein
VDHEAMRRQRGEGLLAGRVVGDLDAETGGGEIKTVLVEERLAGRLQRPAIPPNAFARCDGRKGPTARGRMVDAKRDAKSPSASKTRLSHSEHATA